MEIPTGTRSFGKFRGNLDASLASLNALNNVTGRELATYLRVAEFHFANNIPISLWITTTSIRANFSFIQSRSHTCLLRQVERLVAMIVRLSAYNFPSVSIPCIPRKRFPRSRKREEEAREDRKKELERNHDSLGPSDLPSPEGWQEKRSTRWKPSRRIVSCTFRAFSIRGSIRRWVRLKTYRNFLLISRFN